MSVYFIASDKQKVSQAGNDLKELYGKPADICSWGQIHMAISAAYRENYIMHSYDGGCVYMIGTIFDMTGFNQSVLEQFDSYQKLVSALKNENQRFFGHYVAICIDTRKQCMEVIQDRVGLINTYYTKDIDKGFCCSNDIVLVAKYGSNKKLHYQGVHEFLLLEANVGTETLFSDVLRMKFGNQLILQAGQIKEVTLYKYQIEKLNLHQYLERIQRYFQCLNQYPRRVVIDVSGGYDTRLILAIGHKYINNIVGFSAENTGDGGIDRELSEIITKRLKTDCYFMRSYHSIKVGEKDKRLVVHGTAAMRDSNNSCKWDHLFRERYSCGGLVLGGYGGEVMRAKYNRYSGIDDFVRQYYKGEEAEKICKFKNYVDNVKKALRECSVPENLSSEQLQNWYYAVVQMRIWGSGFIQMSDLYGDVVHPFMDWYLLGPIFGFELTDLKKAKLQKYIIHYYAPELKDVPINCHMGKHPSMKDLLKSLVHNHKFIRNIGTLTYCRIRNLSQNKSNGYEIPKSIISDQPIDLNRIMKKSGKAVRSRMNSIARCVMLTK